MPEGQTPASAPPRHLNWSGAQRALAQRGLGGSPASGAGAKVRAILSSQTEARPTDLEGIAGALGIRLLFREMYPTIACNAPADEERTLQVNAGQPVIGQRVALAHGLAYSIIAPQRYKHSFVDYEMPTKPVALAMEIEVRKMTREMLMPLTLILQYREDGMTEADLAAKFAVPRGLIAGPTLGRPLVGAIR